MIRVKLETFCHSDDMGTFGVLTLPSGMQLYTVERPWFNNIKSISCIPIANYICKPRRYNRGGYDAIEVTEVSGRQYILFHIANTMDNVKGCIGVGTELGAIGGKWAVLNSKRAFNCLMDELGGKSFVLQIKTKASPRIVI